MATIKGVWVFNDTVKTHLEWLNEYQIENVIFTSNGVRFTDIYWNGIDDEDFNTVYHIYYADTLAVHGYYGNISNWENEAYKTVDFGETEQEVSAEFLAWMQENATQQASEETPEEKPTAESVKTKLQSLITASNAKTGKSDANLTDAVKTLLEGYGQGGGGASVTGLRKFNSTIVTDGLPENANIPFDEVASYIGNPPNPITCNLSTTEYGEITNCVMCCFTTSVANTEMFQVIPIAGECSNGHTLTNDDALYQFVSGNVSYDHLTNAIIDIKDAGQYTDWLLANTTAVGGESGGSINIVDELPEVGVEGAYYGVKQLAFTDVFVVSDSTNGLLKQQTEAEGGTVYLEQTTAEEFQDVPSGYDVCLFYITDYGPDIYMAGWGGVKPLSNTLGVPFKGEITDTAQTTEQGYYAYMAPTEGLVLYQYINGEYRRLVKIGGLEYTSNGDGTCYVSGIEKYHEEEIVIPSTSPSGDTVTAIGIDGVEPFAYCYGLRKVVIPDGVTSICHLAFEHCLSLEDITIPDSVTDMGYAFASCRSLTTITLPQGLTNLGYGTFADCTALSTITIPASVTDIYYPFSNCTALKNINFAGTVEQWNAITKSTSPYQWNSGIPATKVVCSDGEVTL